MDVIARSGERPAQLSGMVPRGYKFVGCDAAGRATYREMFSTKINGRNHYYSWVFTRTRRGDVGKIRGPFVPL